MKMIYETDETIDYSAVEKAKATAIATTTGATLATTTGVASAMSMIGLGPVGAVTAAVLGATIAPWLTRALLDEKKLKKEEKENNSMIK